MGSLSLKTFQRITVNNLSKLTRTKLAVDVARVMHQRPDGSFAFSTVPREKANAQRGYLDLPGGKIDDGETSYAAALREMTEEGWRGDVEVKPFYSIELPSAINPGSQHTLFYHRGHNLEPLVKYKERSRGVYPVWGEFDEPNAGRDSPIAEELRKRKREILKAYLATQRRRSIKLGSSDRIVWHRSPEEFAGLFSGETESF